MLVLLVVFGFGAPGVGEYAAQVDEPHRRVAAVQGHPRRAAGRAGDARVEGGGRDLKVEGRGGGAECLAGGLLAARGGEAE